MTRAPATSRAWGARLGPARGLALVAVLACSSASGWAGPPPREMWIELSVPPPDVAASGPAAQRQREAVARQQAWLIRQLQAEGIEPTGRLQVGRNAVAVRVDPAQALRLERLEGVLRVRPGELVRPRETQAAPQTLQQRLR